jgi:hypothetical protein
MDHLAYPEPVRQLLAWGEPEPNLDLPAAAQALTSAQIPELIRMVEDATLLEAPEPETWARVQAWRALGRLRAVEAVPALLWRLNHSDEDDWAREEVPEILANFGEPALAAVGAFLGDRDQSEWGRIATCRVFRALHELQPAVRPACLRILIPQMAKFAHESARLNGFVLGALLDLHAVEALPIIEQAFSAQRIDPLVAGDLEDARIELGVQEKRQYRRAPHELTALGQEMRAAFGMPKLADELLPSPPSLEQSAPFRAPPKVGRNEACPCGSGRKYKKCCGR